MMPSFLQSAEWEAFQKSLGRKTWRVADSLVICHDLPLGFNYLYSPHPRLDDEKSSSVFFSGIEKIKLEASSIFLKIDPSDKFQPPDLKFKVLRSHSIQPRKTVVLDLQKSEDELFREMHEKTRYNIRLAEKKEVNVFIYTKESKKDLPDVFFKLLLETASRDKFHIHERRYYDKLLAGESKNLKNELFFAEYERKIVAAALVNFYRSSTSMGGVATYLHGASSREYREVMAPHLLHWWIIKEAKKRGFQSYDFWGIDDIRWPGLTRFKKGFSGQAVEYPSSADIIYRPVLYKIYKLVRRLK